MKAVRQSLHTYEPYGDGPQTVQKRAKNTSNVHRSSHSYAHTIILYVQGQHTEKENFQMAQIVRSLRMNHMGIGPQTVQNRATNTSNLHRSSHSYAHSIIFYVQRQHTEKENSQMAQIVPSLPMNHMDIRSQTVQNRAKNTSKLHCSSHCYAHTIISYVAPIIQMLTITT